MTLPVVLSRAARFEFDADADWYEARRKGLGKRFTAAVRTALDLIAEQPQRYPIVLDDIREAPIHRFPYCIYYREEPKQIVILAVFHLSRDPTIWQNRG
jgi:plasmid stabilization system protein ParE